MNSPSDAAVRETIICIIEEFFLSSPNIMLYICETGDERQAQRTRLFGCIEPDSLSIQHGDFSTHSRGNRVENRMETG